MFNREVISALSVVTLLGISTILPSAAQDKMGSGKMAPVKASGKMQPSKMQTAPTAKKGALLVTTGKFQRITHNTSGTATIFELPGGSRELRLKGFSTAQGPALHVYLIADGDAKTSEAVGKSGYLDLGKLKNVKGDQTYVVPAKIDLWKYRAVTIWCDKFDVNFGTAALAAKK